MRKFSVLAIGIMFCCTAMAQDMAVGTSLIGKDPVLMGTAGAASASSQNIALSAFSTAAVMPFSEGLGDVSVSYDRWAPNGQLSNRIAAGAGFNFGKRFTFSVAGVYGTGQEYEVIDDYGAPQGTFKTSDMMFGVGLAAGLGEHVGIGVNAKYVRESIYEDLAVNGVLIDASFAFHAKGLNVVLAGKNFGPKVKDSEGNSFKLPSAASVAAYYDLVLAEKHDLGFALNSDVFFNGGVTAALGLQYSWNDMVFVRGGYNYATAKAPLPSHAAIGLGGKFHGVRLDLCYLTASKSLGNTIAASLGYSF